MNIAIIGSGVFGIANAISLSHNKNNKILGIYELDNNKLKVWKNFN